MAIDRQLRISVYSKAQRFRGFVSSPITATFTQLWLGLGFGEFTINASDDVVDDLLQPGARVVVEVIVPFLPESNWVPYDTVMTGVIRNPRGSLMPGGQVTFSVQDDWRLLQNTLARVVPTADPFNPVTDAAHVTPLALTDHAQTVRVAGETLVAGQIAGLSGRMPFPAAPTILPAETAVIFLLEQNVIARRRALFGEANRYVSPNDLGRGLDVRSSLPQPRFDTVETYVTPMLENSNLGLQVRQDSLPIGGGALASINFLFFQPTTWPQVLTPESGFVVGGDWALNSPSVNDAIVGGPGEEAARAFRQYDDSDLQSLYQDLIEVFRDNTGAPINWPDALTDPLLKVEMYFHLRPEVTPARIAEFESSMAAAGADAIAKGAPTSGISPVLAESEGFRWGGTDGFHYGDILTIGPSADSKIPATVSFTERITQVVFTQNDKGLTIVPTLGTKTDDPDKQVALAIRALADANRRQSASR